MQDDEYYAYEEILTQNSTCIYLNSYTNYIQIYRVEADNIAIDDCSHMKDYAR
jgi:hypothetical protein